MPSFRCLISAFLKENSIVLANIESSVKIRKGLWINCGQDDDEDNENYVMLSYSLIYDPVMRQWFAIKPHSLDDKNRRMQELLNKYTLSSRLVLINLDSEVMTLEELANSPCTHNKKTKVVHVDDSVEIFGDIFCSATDIGEITNFAYSLFNRGEKNHIWSSIFLRDKTSCSAKTIHNTKIENIIEIIPGKDLVTLSEEGGLDGPLLKKIEIIIKMLDAVGKLQMRDIVHGDLKPEHFIQKQDGSFGIIDFEFAGFSGKAPGGCGTQEYAAPEICSGEFKTYLQDNYSIGVIVDMILGVDIRLLYKDDELINLLGRLNNSKVADQDILRQHIEERVFEKKGGFALNLMREIPEGKGYARIQPFVLEVVNSVLAFTSPNIDSRSDLSKMYRAMCNLQQALLNFMPQKNNALNEASDHTPVNSGDSSSDSSGSYRTYSGNFFHPIASLESENTEVCFDYVEITQPEFIRSSSF